MRSSPSRRDEPPALPGTGLPLPRRYWSAATIWLALAMAVLDGTIANVALPTLSRELGVAPGTAIWVVNAYQLAITVMLLPLARLGELHGYRRVYIPGLILFTLGSVGCAAAQGLGTLIAARVVQGFGAAAIMSMNAALLRATYPADMLGRGSGYNALVLATSAATGPTLAAIILGVASWRWLFLINLPIGLLAIVIAVRALPHARGRPGDFDTVAALLSAVMMGGVVFGVENVARSGSAPGTVLVGCGLAAAVLLARREWRLAAPLFPFDLLRRPIFALSIATSIAAFAAQSLAYVTMPFQLQTALGLSVVATGLLMTPWPAATGLSAFVAGRLADRWPAGLLGGIGLGLLAAGLLALAHLPPDAQGADIAWRMALCGIGFGTFQSPNNRTIISAAPHHRSGAAGGMLATARLLGQTGGAVGVAAAFHLAGVRAAPSLLLAAAVLAAIAAAISLLRLRTLPGPASVEAAAD